MTTDELYTALQTLPLQDMTIRVGGSPKVIGVVSSPDFQGQHEGIRQQLIWDHLYHRLPTHRLSAIEFVYTFTPSELEALDSGLQPDV